MSYKTIFTRNFSKEINKLPKSAKENLLKTLEKVLENPYAGTKLRGELDGLWRWRTGKYRIIYLIDEKENVVVFLDVGLRKTIYK